MLTAPVWGSVCRLLLRLSQSTKTERPPFLPVITYEQQRRALIQRTKTYFLRLVFLDLVARRAVFLVLFAGFFLATILFISPNEVNCSHKKHFLILNGTFTNFSKSFLVNKKRN